MQVDDRKMADLVARVVERLHSSGVVGRQGGAPAAPAQAPPSNDCWTRTKRPPAHGDRPITRKYASALRPPQLAEVVEARKVLAAAPAVIVKTSAQGDGIYDDVDAACRAAERSYLELVKLGFNMRFPIIDAFRRAALSNLERWSADAAAETKMGRAGDKIKKNRLVATRTPGPEFLQRPEGWSGSDGLTVTRLDPWGVIASIIPCTNSTETVINNGIGMISAGNAVVFNPHPIAKNVSVDAVRTINRAIAAAGGPRELLCCLTEPSIESANALMAHPLTGLVLVTGGGAVVQAAMKSGKRAICAGPGNPPAVVDETACLERTARALVAGASLDNNLVCTDEKEVLAVDSIADPLKALMLKQGCVEVTGKDIDRLTDLVLQEKGGPGKHGMPNKKFVGKNPSVILKELGITADDSVRLVLVDVDKDHPLVWTEQLMPVLPMCRLPDAASAMQHALAVEEGRKHTASIHSERLDRITTFVNTMNCSICVVNDSNFAGLGMNGEGYTSFSISTPTGEGLTTARTFCRERRLAIASGGLKRQ
jgi:propionaldehyde dehydrogenase